jgi:phosphoribosylaminoimidazolecarboxamide formyltransferase/IMP cyclohydrolase
VTGKSGIERALISVYDKTGIVELARELASLGVEIVSTGGTAKLLRDAGVAVRDVAELTGWPEMLGGRVKTLHPKVHGGILFQRAKAEDRKQSTEHGIVPIDLVVVNLYPFSATAATPGVTAAELIENIDIGGPAMVRSAAKNFQSVGVVTDHADYEVILQELREHHELSLATRLNLARKAYARTARYDGEIATELERLAVDETSKAVTIGRLENLPSRLNISLERKQTMRYGENPHQAAALYLPAGSARSGLAGAKQLQGKELSYNNLVDLDSAWALAKEFRQAGAAIIKHNNPCGAAEQESLVDAYLKALACDPISAFGGVLAFKPADRRRNRGGSGEAIRRVHRRAGIRSCGAGKVRGEEKFAAAGNAARRRAGRNRGTRAKAHFGGRARSGGGPTRIERGRTESRDRTCSHSGRTARPAVCLESMQAREVQRDCVRAPRPDRRSRCGPDEPR